MAARRGERPVHPADVALLQRLGAVVDVIDPVPTSVVAMGKALFAFRDPDASLMQLVDTAVPEAAVRSAATSTRIHFFELGTPPDDLALDVELTPAGDGCTVVGALMVGDDGPVPATWALAVETAGRRITVEVTPEGTFRLEGIAGGLLRLRVERPGQPPATTPWLES